MASDSAQTEAWFLQSTAPVLLPALDALTYSRKAFKSYILQDLAGRHGDHGPMNIDDHGQPGEAATDATSESATMLTPSTTTAADLANDMADMQVDAAAQASSTGHTFLDALRDYQGEDTRTPNLENKTLTEKGDVTNISTTNPLVDLFADLEEHITGPRLNDLLNAAWAHDPLAALKIIFNARSIHLGKASRKTFYQCAGWLATNHPATLVANLPWLSRPVIPKKERQDKEDDDDDADLVLIEADDKTSLEQHDVKHGVSHGYWKDLLNMLALAANDKLHVLADPATVLNVKQPKQAPKGKGRQPRASRVAKPSGRRAPTLVATRPAASTKQLTDSQRRAKDKVASDTARCERRATRFERQDRVTDKLQNDPVYRALHLSVARLFAQQLQIDHERLKSNDPKLQRAISLCAKWAPSHDRFHDRHTLITTSIAEILFPRSALGLLEDQTDRETYLRHAREAFRKTTSALRKHLDVVERNLSAKAYDAIRYERVPSQAMRQYTPLFIARDADRFEAFLDDVADGKAAISGATLLPSAMVHGVDHRLMQPLGPTLRPAELIKRKTARLQARALDSQWNALVQRIKDSGTLASSIAVCDVSGSMSGPVFPDGTCPMDSAIGLSLLIASVTEAPFGGTFISFSENPAVQVVDLHSPFSTQVHKIRQAPWGMTTNFQAVFTQCILPRARKYKVKPEDMVKRIFVFSDMHFDAAKTATEKNESKWTSSFDRIKKEYDRFGYAVPELIFWNLAGGRGGASPKPVTTDDMGTALVSGYSQGLLKVFLDSGGFEDGAEEVIEQVEGEDGVEVTKTLKKKPINPLSTVKKAIGHPAYAMLRVVD